MEHSPAHLVAARPVEVSARLTNSQSASAHCGGGGGGGHTGGGLLQANRELPVNLQETTSRGQQPQSAQTKVRWALRETKSLLTLINNDPTLRHVI